ncbi:MAG: hypothetical protein IAE77_03245 [Prosthecobacter sp.]|jgi:hypothetical protein|uniref:hypothetical protein n=1 Tax=Prosthecobacter sp. TaxID=1965333 RepID=UPI001A04ADB5|nr:hypothetical protein [Prosthecobacter sp.]MBE2282461.1 hypothetical protein [Prosthecobacter sp.]
MKTTKPNSTPAALLVVLTLLGVTLGSVAYSQTKLPEPCKGYRKCSSCSCSTYRFVPNTNWTCYCGHGFGSHGN